MNADIPATALLTGNRPVKGSAKNMINAEKEFRSQSDLKSFKGTIEEEDETTYTNKDEWLSAVDDIDWKNLGGASSKSTYSDIITTIDFDFEEISYGVEKK